MIHFLVQHLGTPESKWQKLNQNRNSNLTKFKNINEKFQYFFSRTRRIHRPHKLIQVYLPKYLFLVQNIKSIV